ncbi:MAG: hypothetical protein ACI9V8_000405 [Urechidicola sp.]|jgi:hypothetical protein
MKIHPALLIGASSIVTAEAGYRRESKLPNTELNVIYLDANKIIDG